MAAHSGSQEPSAINPKWIMKHAEARFVITDAKSMMVHHTIVWNIVVLASDPWTMYDFTPASVIPRKSSEINLLVREESSDGRVLAQPRTTDMSCGNLLQKSFLIELGEPLMPGDESRTLYIEYDWEEPDRYYQYGFGLPYKRFKFALTSPPELHVEPTVYRIDNASGEKIKESEVALIRKNRDDGSSYYEWIGTGLQFSTYRLDFTK